MEDVAAWTKAHPEVVAGLAIASVLMLVGSALLLPVIVGRLPADHFMHTRRESWSESAHPVLRLTWAVIRNLVGAALIAAGFVMLFVPGQGILTILAGLGLVDFPGKRALEIRLLRIGSVQRGINWIRERKGKPPLQLPDGVEDEREGPPSEADKLESR